METLEVIRKNIDAIDDAIVKLLAERMELVGKVAQSKLGSGKAVRDAVRENNIIERLTANCSANVKIVIPEVYEAIFNSSRKFQDKVIGGANNKMKRIMVINGVNLDMLGKREPELYGNKNYNDLVEFIEQSAHETGVLVDCRQSNHEGTIVEFIHECWGVYDGIVINPGAYTHTSIAILDALKSVSIHTVEVHITDINEREPYRKISYVSEYAELKIAGKGFNGYADALKYLSDILR